MTAPDYPYVRLGHAECVRGRPFTDVSLNDNDLWAMGYMAGRLVEVVYDPDEAPADGRLLHKTLGTPDSGLLRVILNNKRALRTEADVYLVGFFGQKRPAGDRAVIEGVDVSLQGEFAAFPDVLGYCTMRMRDGNFGNMVLLATDTTSEHWRESTHHQYATAEIAPSYYSSVRLHNAVLHGGLTSDPHIELKRTKYYDYENGFWCGLRELQ